MSKILMFEAPWENNIIWNPSAYEIYRSIGALPFSEQIISRPLISTSQCMEDIDNFLSLDENKSGANIIIFAGHGSDVNIQRDDDEEIENKKIIQGFGEVIELTNLEQFALKTRGNLARSILILDSCFLGRDIESFRDTIGAFGVIGYTKEIEWVDSGIFTFVMLCKFNTEMDDNFKNIFEKNTTGGATTFPKLILDNMYYGDSDDEDEPHGVYASLMCELGVDYSFKPR